MTDFYTQFDRKRQEAKAPRQPHEPTICNVTGYGHYHYKNWSHDFRCPSCGRVGRFSLNFLGQRHVMCDGTKFTKQPKET